MAVKPLRIRFDEIDGFVKIYGGIRYLVLFDSGLCHAIYNRISEKSGIKDSINHDFARIRIDSSNSLPIEKTLTFHVIILIKSVVNKNENNYYYNIFSGKGLYKDKSNTQYF